MGGGRRFDYPKSVWSPAGGWWANPVHWRRNTVIYFIGSMFVAYAGYLYAEPRTVTYTPKKPSLHLKDHKDEDH